MSDVFDADLFSNAASGPGSQPNEVDGAELDILQLPSGMDTYQAPPLPEPEETGNLIDGLNLLQQLQASIDQWQPSVGVTQLSLNALDSANRELVDQVLGEGEVGIIIEDEFQTRIQESVLTGVWRIQTYNLQNKLLKDEIEVNSIPSIVRQNTFDKASNQANADLINLAEGVMNAPPLLTEINDKLAEFNSNKVAHTINLTLLPQTENDLTFLDNCLGAGKTAILSRGYGNCRINSTATQNVWWVRYFNSQDKNILNSIEIAEVPEVACAAPEDIADSAVRLREILEIYL